MSIYYRNWSFILLYKIEWLILATMLLSNDLNLSQCITSSLVDRQAETIEVKIIHPYSQALTEAWKGFADQPKQFSRYI